MWQVALITQHTTVVQQKRVGWAIGVTDCINDAILAHVIAYGLWYWMYTHCLCREGETMVLRTWISGYTGYSIHALVVLSRVRPQQSSSDRQSPQTNPQDGNADVKTDHGVNEKLETRTKVQRKDRVLSTSTSVVFTNPPPPPSRAFTLWTVCATEELCNGCLPRENAHVAHVATRGAAYFSAGFV